MRDDIYGGLRNALERGTSLEQAIKSFTNAGYPESEVREAAKALDGGSTLLAVQTSQQTPQLPSLPSRPSQPQQTRPLPSRQPVQVRTTFDMPKQHHRPSLLVIILSTILFLSIVSFVLSLVFKKEIAVFLARIITG